MEESDPPPPPPNIGGFKGKRVRSRSLSRVQKKHSNNQKKRKDQHPLTEHDPAHTASASASTDISDQHPPPLDFKYTSKQKYADMPASCQLELKATLLEIKKKDVIIEKLTHKVKQLSQATRSARTVAREAKNYAKNVEDDAKKAAKRMEVEVDNVRTMEQVSVCIP
jgi:hypothetical protein